MLQRQGLHGLRLLARHQAHVLAHLGPSWWLQSVCLVTIEIPDDVLKIFHSSWAQWAGYPRRILLDQDGGFEGTFAEMIGRVSELDYSAAEAHWQNGEVESFNKAFRFAAERVIDERQLAGQDEMQTLGIIVSAAMTDKVRTERVRRCLSTCWTARGKSKLYKDKNQMNNFGYGNTSEHKQICSFPSTRSTMHSAQLSTGRADLHGLPRTWGASVYPGFGSMYRRFHTAWWDH